MIWTTWRQHRAEVLAAAVLVAGVTAILLAVGLPMHAAYADRGVGACLTRSAPVSCHAVIDQFRNQFSYAKTYLVWLNLVPVALGVFIGAPLVARELETGTWQLAFTQGVPRVRWLATKLVALSLLIVALATAVTVLVTWFRQPWDALDGRLSPDGFDLEGPTLPAYALFAFAAGTAAGLLVRRSVPALAAAGVAFIAVRYSVEVWLRPRYQAPLTQVWDPVTERGGARGGWSLKNGFVDAAGHHLDQDQYYDTVYKSALAAQTDVPNYLHSHGMRLWNTYQPAERFWTFQLIETAIYAGLTLVLLALVVRRVRRAGVIDRTG
jgi:hypothetical protein